MTTLDQEEDNFFRNLRVLELCGSDALREVLKHELSNQNTSLEQYLSLNNHEIYHLFDGKPCCQCSGRPAYSTRPVLNISQLQILLDKNKHLPIHNPKSISSFCCSPVKATVTLEVMDTTLLGCLIRNFGSNYKGNPAIRNEVERLIQYRNRYAHNPNLRVSDADFQLAKKEITNIVRSIISLFGSVPIAVDMNISEQYQKPLDKSLCMQYHAKLIEDLQLQQEVLKNQEEIIKVNVETAKGQERIIKSQEELQDQLHQLTATLHISLSTDARNEHTAWNNIDQPSVSESHQHLRNVKSLSTEISERANPKAAAIEIQTRSSQRSTTVKCLSEKLSAQKVGNIRHKPPKRTKKKSCGSESAPGLKNLTYQSHGIVKQHDEDQTYVETVAVTLGLQILKEHKFLVVVARSGSGKSQMCLHIASHLMHEGVKPVILYHKDILHKRELINPNDNNLIIIEDLFGRENPAYSNEYHSNILDCIKSWVKAGHLKIVLTVSGDMSIAEPILERHDIFISNSIMDMENEWFGGIPEKYGILSQHAKVNKIEISDDSCEGFCDKSVKMSTEGSFQLCQCLIQLITETNTFIGFPQCCRMFCKNPYLTQLGIKYFRNASSELVRQINEQFLVKALDGNLECLYQYALLIYMAINDCFLKSSYNQTDEFLKNESLLRLFKSLHESTVNVRAVKVNTALRSLEGTLLRKLVVLRENSSETIFEFQHDTIRKAVLISYGSEYPQLVLDMSDIKFIIDYIFPDGLGHDQLTELPIEKVHVSYKMVFKRLRHILESVEVISLSIKKEGRSFKITSCTAKSSKLRRQQKKVTENYKTFIPPGLVPESVGRYLKNYSVGNEKPINDFISELSTSEHAYHISGILDGLSDRGTCEKFLTQFPNICKTFLLQYGSALLLSELIQPVSSKKLIHGKYMFVEDSLLQCTLTAHLQSDMFKWFSPKCYFRYGRYVHRVSIDEQNKQFAHELVQQLTNIDFTSSMSISWFINGFLDHEQHIQMLEVELIQPLLLQYGLVEVLVSYCRPIGTCVSTRSFIELERGLLLRLIDVRSQMFFDILNGYINDIEVRSRFTDNEMYAYACDDVVSDNYCDVQAFFIQCLKFAIDVKDDQYIDKVLDKILSAMKTKLDPDNLQPYVHLFLHVFQDEEWMSTPFERYPSLASLLE